MSVDLSVLIPARNEEFLGNTIDDVVAHARGRTEVIAVCDGGWPPVAIKDHPRVTLVNLPHAIGQRAATNVAARLARGRYVMKLDAHCAVAEGFDVALVDAGDALGRDVTQIPRMKNLQAFEWVCEDCGAQTYQGPHPAQCVKCARPTTQRRNIVWRAKPSPVTDFARFDTELKFQYWSGGHGPSGQPISSYKKRPAAAADFPEVMSSIGACFVMRRDRFAELGGLDERHGSWGQFGTEIACKSWLSGGRQVVNRSTWFAHLFRTQAGFRFPYPLAQSEVDQARRHSKATWMGNTWTGQRLPLAWLIDKFAPVPEWHDPEGADVLASVIAAGDAFTSRAIAV